MEKRRQDALYRTWKPLRGGYRESLNGTLRNELHNVGVFYGLKKARFMIERRRRE